MPLLFGAASLTGIKHAANEDRHVEELNASPGPAFAVFDGHGGEEAAAYLADPSHLLGLVDTQLRQSIGTPQVEQMARICREFNATARTQSQLVAKIEAQEASLENAERQAKTPPPYQVSDELTQLKTQVRGLLGDMQRCVDDFEQQEAARRQYMDQFYEFVREMFPAVVVQAFEQLDQELLSAISPREDGSTAVVVWLVGHSHELTLYCANVGDSRAVLCRGGRTVALSVDHKPEDPRERARIEHQGGAVHAFQGGVQRVHAPSAQLAKPGTSKKALAMSRAFGDRPLKEPVNCIAPKPDIHAKRLCEGDELVVVASDGVWHVLSNQETVDVARQHVGDADAAANAVVQAARTRGSRDDITVIVVQFVW